MIAPLWQRALDARRREQCNASMHEPRKGHRLGGRKRKYPPVVVGDRFGPREVVALLPRGDAGNERVRVKCANGHESDAFVSNLRKHPNCVQCGWTKRGTELTWMSPGFTADEVASLIREDLVRRAWAGTYRMTVRGRSVDLRKLPEVAAEALKRLRAAEQEVRSS